MNTYKSNISETRFGESAIDAGAVAAGIGPCINVECSGGYIYSISSIMGDSLSRALCQKYFKPGVKNGALTIFRAGEDGLPVMLSQLTGLGNVRQIAVSGGFAYITAREDGLYIIDVSHPEKPSIACHWDTVEFATGIALYGKVAAIGCRTFGIELIDISVPDSPKHISAFRSGEVQSVFIDDGILYTGSWAEREVNLIDIRDAMHPKKLGKAELDGRGDGLFVRNGLLYAATGHHSRSMKITSSDDPGYGAGNGFEIFDVSDPSEPKLLSRVKLVDRYYYCCFDMWNVTVSYPYAYVNDTFNGLYVFDVSSPETPALLEHYVIRMPSDTVYFQEMITDVMRENRSPILPFDYEKEMFGPVCAAAVSDGYAYIAGGLSDLHTVSGKYFHALPETEPQNVPACDFYDVAPGEGMEGCTVLRTSGQARAAAWDGGLLYAACGESGILVYGGEKMEYRGRLSTEGIAMDVCFMNGRMYVAEGEAGLSIWEQSDDGMKLTGRYRHNDMIISQAVVSGNGKHALLHCDCTHLLIVNVSDPKNTFLELQDVDFPGLLYGRQISVTGAGGRYYTCWWNGNVNHWYDLGGDVPVKLPDNNKALVCCAYDDTRMLALAFGGFALFDPTGRKLEKEDFTRLSEGLNYGKVSLFGSKLFVSNRFMGRVSVYDISDLKKPKLLKDFSPSGYPDIVAYNGRWAAVPAGHQGIIRFEI